MGERQETQGALIRCECGGDQQVTPTLSPFEFAYRCARCERAGTISWNHAGPVPVFVPAAGGRQGELF
jgi:hypothetical protein